MDWAAHHAEQTRQTHSSPPLLESSAAFVGALSSGFATTGSGVLGFCSSAHREKGLSRGAAGEAGHEWPADL